MTRWSTPFCSMLLRYGERGLLGRPEHCEEEFLLDMGSFAGSLSRLAIFKFGRGYQEHGRAVEEDGQVKR